MDTKVDGRTFTYLDDLVFHLFGHFRYDLFDTRRMDTTVLHQLMQRQTCYLTTYGIVGGEGDRLRRIVYDDLHTGSGFEGTDVTSLTTDDTTLHFVILDMEDRNGRFGCGLGSHTLDGLDDDFLRLFIGLQTRIIHDLVDIRHGCRLGFIFEGLYQLLLRLFRRHSAQLLQLALRLVMHLIDFLLTEIKRLLALLDGLQFLIHFIEAALYIPLTLVELLLTLLQALLLLLQALILLTHTIVVLQLQGDEFLLSLNDLVLFDHLRLFFRFLDEISGSDTRDEVVDSGSYEETDYCTNNCYDH